MSSVDTPSRSKELLFGGFVAATVLLSSAVAIVLIQAATLGHRWVDFVYPAIAAWLAMAISVVPPLAVIPWIPLGPARQLLIIGWRLCSFLAAILLAGQWEGDQGNCYLRLLMACYFVAILLESWLLISHLRRRA